jgi:hypothetical protein
MQTLTLSSTRKDDRLLDSKTPLRTRISRFLSERYAHRERPSVAAEFLLLAVIVLITTWPMFTLAHVLGLGR